MEKTHLGVDISEKALTKNYRGVITHAGNDKIVTIGQRVHIPHFKVVDYDIDGEEYAVTKESDLFAIEDGTAYVPINRHVLVRKCVNDHMRDEAGEIVLHMTDGFIELTNWVEIIDVSDDCEHITREDIGSFCVAPESSEKLQRILYSKDFMLHESAIEFVTDGD
jgi:co-chaperonin GroES (HSP10)